MLDICEIVVAIFSITDKVNQVRFYKKTFLVANVNLEIVFRMLFLTLSSINIDFFDWKLCWRSYTTSEALPTTRYVKLVRKKDFPAAARDSEYDIFVVHIASLDSIPLNVYLFYRSQIASLIIKKTLTKVFTKYADFANIFSSDLISKLPKQTKINHHTI